MEVQAIKLKCYVYDVVVCSEEYILRPESPGPFTIESPGFSGSGYNASMECEWWILNPSRGTVRVEFTALSIERHGECLYDHVEIYSENFGKSECTISSIPSRIT